MFKLKHKETEQERRQRLLQLTDIKCCGRHYPSMKAQIAVKELCHYLLGEDWYTLMIGSQEQINTEIVSEIESEYKRRYKAKF